MPRTTGRGVNKRHAGFYAPDSQEVVVVRRDISGGENNRQAGSIINDNQCTVLQNCDLSVPGERKKRPGQTLIEDLSNNAITGMFSFEPIGGTPELLVTEGTNIKGWPGSGSFSAAYKSDFTTSLQTKMIRAYKSGTGDVVLISNGTDNVFEMTEAHGFTDLGDTNTSPPKTTVMALTRSGRVLALKDELLYFGDASPSDFSTAFDRTTSAFRIPCGEERSLLDTRDLGTLIGGSKSVWSLSMSITPDPTTDKPEKLVDYGVAAGETFVQAGDDYIFLSYDGVRGLKRTVQDKLQSGRSEPLSYVLKDEFELINWAQISKACAVFWDNKYFISLPTSGSSYNNRVWVYWPSLQSWMIITGWNVSAWAKFKVNGQEFLYGGDGSDGKVLRCWYGDTDNSTSYTYTEEGREEDMGYALNRKVGGVIKLVADNSGDHDISVYVSLDGGSYNLLGALNCLVSGVSFPTTFPVTFTSGLRARDEFHFDSYGPWYLAKFKFTCSEDDEDVKIFEHTISATIDEFQSED